MKIKKAFKYRLKLNKLQEKQCVSFLGACRFVYNRGLAERKQTFEADKKTLTYYEQNNELVNLKKKEETKWLKEVHSQILQQSLKDLDSAFRHFFRRLKLKENPGYPRFKRKGITDSFRYPQGVKIQGNITYLPKIGWVKFRKSREIEGELKQTTIKREGDHWYISFSCEIEITDPILAQKKEDNAIGIDVGLTRYAVIASGKENKQIDITPPKFLNIHLPRLKILYRRLSKKVKGSQNFKKTKGQIARLHAKIKHARDNFAHQLSTLIIKNHDIICVESLNILNLLQKKLSRYISDAGWRQFLNYLKYKALEKGKHFVEIGKYFPSTKLCFFCGHKQKMSLGEREYHCKNCDIRIDRDYNSAISIKAAGMTVLNACGAT